MGHYGRGWRVAWFWLVERIWGFSSDRKDVIEHILLYDGWRKLLPILRYQVGWDDRFITIPLYRWVSSFPQLSFSFIVPCEQNLRRALSCHVMISLLTVSLLVLRLLIMIFLVTLSVTHRFISTRACSLSIVIVIITNYVVVRDVAGCSMSCSIWFYLVCLII